MCDKNVTLYSKIYWYNFTKNYSWELDFTQIGDKSNYMDYTLIEGKMVPKETTEETKEKVSDQNY